tara:strand:- start:585 stop:764 length:180 start_codon:yes stop_codon:yes gene_type:complete
MNANEWVLVVQNSACTTYQILDDAPQKRKAGWVRLLGNVIAFGCALYGIPRSALDFIWD